MRCKFHVTRRCLDDFKRIRPEVLYSFNVANLRSRTLSLQNLQRYHSNPLHHLKILLQPLPTASTPCFPFQWMMRARVALVACGLVTVVVVVRRRGRATRPDPRALRKEIMNPLAHRHPMHHEGEHRVSTLWRQTPMNLLTTLPGATPSSLEYV